MTLSFTPVPEDQQDDIKQPKRAGWFNALKQHGMLQMTARPTLTGAQKSDLDAQGIRMRSRVIDSAIYVWLEEKDEVAVPDDELPI